MLPVYGKQLTVVVRYALAQYNMQGRVQCIETVCRWSGKQLTISIRAVEVGVAAARDVGVVPASDDEVMGGVNHFPSRVVEGQRHGAGCQWRRWPGWWRWSGLWWWWHWIWDDAHAALPS